MEITLSYIGEYQDQFCVLLTTRKEAGGAQQLMHNNRKTIDITIGRQQTSQQEDNRHHNKKTISITIGRQQTSQQEDNNHHNRKIDVKEEMNGVLDLDSAL